MKLTVDANGVRLTIGHSSVLFAGSQFADGTTKRLQICADGTSARLYVDCVAIGTKGKPFTIGDTPDLEYARMDIFRKVFGKLIFKVKMYYF